MDPVNDARHMYDVGYCSGAFDMFHVGQLNLLRRARNRCRHLVVGVASDEYLESVKGRAPVVPCDERIDIISALGIVDEVVIDRSQDKLAIWQQRPFDVIFKDGDWQGTPNGYHLERVMGSVGVDVVYFPHTHRPASSMLRSYLLEGGAVE
ncbi:adenylyltransferase/cytidyltransferase family protein [Aeromicrobium wangtongii]|uniref:adenylyltransferase/cytidyltransferase family protein n=1 Tax=Aeromicrobium wangtongii TaxID=2969247 RepID=UPI0020175EDF|nr:adenylyltransferase/cytidyltransferase family protein [Aeromicrobium wangtongii]MCL3817735.1 adenylyltransferase/cytidyltransferase family protein [Aeromicrobium wangtongii]